MSKLNFFQKIVARMRANSGSVKKGGANASVAALACALLFLAFPVDAMAAVMTLPFIEGLGCNVANWLKGPLAIMVFAIVFIVTLVVGMFAKMDWGKIISVVVIYGLIQGFVSIMLTSGSIQLPGCIS